MYVRFGHSAEVIRTFDCGKQECVKTTATTRVYIYTQTIKGRRCNVAVESAVKPAVVFELAPLARKINEARNDPLYRTRYYWQQN